MARKEITICDLCGKEITSVKQKYNLMTNEFVDSFGDHERNIQSFDFCESCAIQFPKLLQDFVRIKGKEETCRWISNGVTLDTSCGHEIDDDDNIDDMVFCPYCGGRIKNES